MGGEWGREQERGCDGWEGRRLRQENCQGRDGEGAGEGVFASAASRQRGGCISGGESTRCGQEAGQPPPAHLKQHPKTYCVQCPGPELEKGALEKIEVIVSLSKARQGSFQVDRLPGTQELWVQHV